MNKIISARSEESDISFLPELLTNASVKSLFWKPKFPSEDSFSYYLPLIFWLVDALRPREVVQLGVGSGAAFLGLCQAVDKLDLGTGCYGYGPYVRTDDAHTADAHTAVPAALQKTCDAHFDGIAILSAADPTSAANRFADGAVDLLIADLAPDADLITSLAHDFPPRMSRSGVMILHGTTRAADDSPLQAYLGRLRAGGRAIEFDWGEGAMLVLVGTEPSARMTRLAEQLRRGSPSRQTAMTMLRRLGSAHWLGARVDQLTTRDESARETATAARHEFEALRTRLEDLSTAYDLRSNKIADIQAQLFDAQQSSLAATAADSLVRDNLASAQARTADLEQALADADATLGHKTAQIDDLAAKLAAAEVARGTLDDVAATRARDAKAATDRIALLEDDLKAASRASDDMGDFISQQDKETQRVRRDAARLEKQILAIRQSRSWRILGPVRAVSRLVTGRKRPEPFKPLYLEVPQLDRRGRLAQIMPALKREFARPGSLSQEGMARFLRYQLWGGADGPALIRLEAMLTDAGISDIARLRAACTLSTWYDYSGDRARALEVLDVVALAPAEIALSKDRIVRKAVLYAALEQTDMAIQMIESLPEPASQFSDVLLVRANLAANDGARLTRINRVFERRGLVPLRRTDSNQPLSLNNITTVAVDAQIADNGLVSVIMPAFNSAATIETALRSVLSQSYRNLEVLVVDDCSTDDTAAVVARMAKQDPRLTLLVQKKNAGAYPARNRGLTVARGAFITTHDADDWSHPQKIEEQVRALVDAPRTMAAVTHWARVRPTLRFTTNWRLSAEIIHWSHSSLLFRREIYEKHGGWDNVRVSADTEFIWRIEAAYGKRAVVKLHKDVPLAFALDDDTSLTRTKLTHVSTSYSGLRHYYSEISRYFLSQYPKGLPPEAKAAKTEMVPAEMHSREDMPVVVDLWLKGDFTRDATAQKLRAQLEANKDKRIGVSHVIDPTNERDIPSYAAIFCNAFFETLRIHKPRIVLPGLDVTAAQVIDLDSRVK